MGGDEGRGGSREGGEGGGGFVMWGGGGRHICYMITQVPEGEHNENIYLMWTNRETPASF